MNKRKEETKSQKHPLIYSNRWKKIQKGRTIWITPTSRPIKEGPLACVYEESYFKNWAMVVFISYLIILKLILILVVLNYPKLYLGRALDYGPFAYGRWKTNFFFFFPLRKERRSWQNCLLMILSEFSHFVICYIWK